MDGCAYVSDLFQLISARCVLFAYCRSGVACPGNHRDSTVIDRGRSLHIHKGTCWANWTYRCTDCTAALTGCARLCLGSIPCTELEIHRGAKGNSAGKFNSTSPVVVLHVKGPVVQLAQASAAHICSTTHCATRFTRTWLLFWKCANVPHAAVCDSVLIVSFDLLVCLQIQESPVRSCKQRASHITSHDQVCCKSCANEGTLRSRGRLCTRRHYTVRKRSVTTHH